ncbi:hypothetical protein RSJ3_2234 [Clostridium botulinum]|nr:hypothetical protein RSJ3_2234 [Clostridium botulinum]
MIILYSVQKHLTFYERQNNIYIITLTEEEKIENVIKHIKIYFIKRGLIICFIKVLEEKERMLKHQRQ